MPNKNIQDKYSHARDLISKNEPSNYFKGITELNDLEIEIKKTKNNTLLIDYYYNCAIIFLERFDFSSLKTYINKGFLVITKSKKPRRLGEFYQLLGILYDYQGEDKKSISAYLLSEKYFAKYGSLSMIGDTYYNLTLIYLNKKDWKKTIQYGLKCDSVWKTISNDSPHLHLKLAEAYLNIDNYNKTKNYLDLAKKSKDFTKDNYRLLSVYYRVNGDLLYREGRYEEAAQMLFLSNEIYKNETRKFINTTNKNQDLENNMRLTVFNLEKLKTENQYKKERLKYTNFIILLGVAIILALGIIVLLQSRNSIYKTKTNKILSGKNQELKEALSIRSKLLDTFFHEFRTPLNAILSIIYLFNEKYNKVEKENLEILNYSADYLLNLSNQVIEYNILNQNKSSSIKWEAIDLKTVTQDVINSFISFNVNNNKIEIAIDAEISEILLFDKVKLIQILNNVIDNAFKFTKNGDILITLISVAKNDTIQKIKFVIKDNGIGISEDIKPKVFDLFFQGSDEIRIGYGGSGLGLAIAKKTLNLFNSTFEIQSKLGQGTSISFELDFKVVATKQLNLFNNIALKNTERKIKILLVEDNKINQQLTKKILNSKNYDCEIAENGLEAVEKVTTKDYSLILMDIMMPIMDGFEASLKISNIKPHIPIIALTSVSEKLHEAKFMEAKIKKVLNKPLNVEELMDTILTYSL